MIRLPPAPLFLQTLGLVIATLIAAQIATLVVILSLPPPPPEIYTVGDVVQAIRGDAQTPTRDGHLLTTVLATSPPASDTQGRRRLVFRAAVAQALGLDPSAIVVTQKGPPRLVAFKERHGRPGAEAARSRLDSPEQPLLFGPFSNRRPAQ